MKELQQTPKAERVTFAMERMGKSLGAKPDMLRRHYRASNIRLLTISGKHKPCKPIAGLGFSTAFEFYVVDRTDFPRALGLQWYWKGFLQPRESLISHDIPLSATAISSAKANKGLGAPNLRFKYHWFWATDPAFCKQLASLIDKRLDQGTIPAQSMAR
jgi:hypothetical protein